MDNSIESKRCSGCGIVKSIDEFYTDRHKKSGRDSHCKVCKSERTKKRHQNNLDHYRKYWRERRLVKKYNMTNEGRESLAKKQDYRCAMCKEEKLVSELEVDHDHKTGVVRGLLCSRCNSLLGRLGDTVEAVIEWCVVATSYLQSELG